jgi:EpsD family peptidyl-prolyl cis-trans isomerase
VRGFVPDHGSVKHMGRKRDRCLGWRGVLLNLGSAVMVGGFSYGCGSAVQGIDSRGEILATVNGYNITTGHVRSRLAQLDMRDDGNTRRQLLEAMIDEQLLIQRALGRGLDKEQSTREALETARRQVLVQAAIAEPAGSPGIAEKEARNFYRANPDLFERRKIYTFHRFEIRRESIARRVRTELDETKSLEQVSALLRVSGLNYVQSTEVRGAEALPLQVLAQAVKMAPGDILMFTEGGRSTVLLQLAAAVPDPMSLAAALPGIRKSLLESRRGSRALKMVSELRRKATIEYVTEPMDWPNPTALADGKEAVREPPFKKSLQSEQITEVR